jgi:hypothetical protein
VKSLHFADHHSWPDSEIGNRDYSDVPQDVLPVSDTGLSDVIGH